MGLCTAREIGSTLGALGFPFRCRKKGLQMGAILKMKHGTWALKSMSISVGQDGGTVISDGGEQCCRGQEGGPCVGKEYGLVTMQGRNGKKDWA